MNLQDSGFVVYDAVCFDIIGEHKGGLQPDCPPLTPFKQKKKYYKHDDTKGFT
jgi:hypothetical protein